MTEIQIKYAEGFLKIIHANGGHDDIDRIYYFLEQSGLDPDDNPLDFEFAKDFLLDNGFIKDWGGENYRFKAVIDLTPVLELGITEYLKQKERKEYEQFKQTITAENVMFNNGPNSSGSIHDSSVRLNQNHNAPHKAENKMIKEVVIGILIAVAAGLILWLIIPS